MLIKGPAASGNIYHKLSYIPKTDDKDIANSIILINSASEQAFIIIDPDDNQNRLFKISKIQLIVNELYVPYPNKLNNRIINLTASSLGLDWDGDTVDYRKWVAYRDNAIKYNGIILRIQVKWYKTLLKVRYLIGKLKRR